MVTQFVVLNRLYLLSNVMQTGSNRDLSLASDFLDMHDRCCDARSETNYVYTLLTALNC